MMIRRRCETLILLIKVHIFKWVDYLYTNMSMCPIPVRVGNKMPKEYKNISHSNAREYSKIAKQVRIFWKTELTNNYVQDMEGV